jgi:hypothetical protein
MKQEYEPFDGDVRFISTSANLRKATVRFVVPLCSSVHLSAWTNSTPTARIFMKLDRVFFENMSRGFKFR